MSSVGRADLVCMEVRKCFENAAISIGDSEQQTISSVEYRDEYGNNTAHSSPSEQIAQVPEVGVLDHTHLHRIRDLLYQI